MKKMIYVKLSERTSSDYVVIDKMFLESDFENHYNYIVDIYKKHGINPIPTIEEFKKEFIYINVKYDGRKRAIYETDVMKSLEKEGYINQVASGGMFGGYYKKTDKLKVNKETLTDRFLIAA